MATPTFPRLAGARPRMASMPRFASGQQLWSMGGRGQMRSMQNMGRVWTETYPLLDLSNPNVRALAQAINQALREKNVWIVQHPYWQARKGVGGGSPLVNSPAQIVAVPENFSDTSWGVINSPIRTAGQPDPFGGTAAYLVEDDDAALSEGIARTVVFTGDGVKAVAVFLKPNTASITHRIEIRENPAVADRLDVAITWSGGVPSVVMTAGTHLLSELIPNSGGWYRFHFQTTSLTVAGNTFLVHVRIGGPASDVGSVFAFGVNVWNAPIPGPYRGPSQPGPGANEALQIGNLLYVRGATPSVTAWLRPGDLIQVSGAPVIYDVTAQVNTNAAGGAIIPISPPLFEGQSPADGAVVEIVPASIFFRAAIVDVQDFPNIDSTSYIDPGMQITWREQPQ